jgi:hypothetical protein
MNTAPIPSLTRLRLVVIAVILAITGLAVTASQLPSARAATTSAAGTGGLLGGEH